MKSRLKDWIVKEVQAIDVPAQTPHSAMNIAHRPRAGWHWETCTPKQATRMVVSADPDEMEAHWFRIVDNG